MIPEEVIQKVVDENNIVDVISEVVTLKRSGSNYVGLCPFHSEKTPSFMVSSEKQIFKCFGCGEAGNVISFVMKYRNMPFIDAVKLLAERANINIEQNGKNSIRKDSNQKLYQLNVDAARYFYSNLNKDNVAKNYLISRGLSERTIRIFGLGFSYDRWDGLLKYLLGKGYTQLDLLSLGLIIKSERGTYYDRFRNRIMFPVFDYKGRVIGFGGRVMDDSKPKYLNSPDSIVFKKGSNLYGLNYAIKNNRDRTIVIVEGYMDCITLHQYGITNVVASLGTALTREQAKLLKRYADSVIISYDADLAGQAATIRGLEILRKEGFDVKVLTVPEGKDPDEFVRNNGKEAFVKLLQSAIPLIEYRLKKAAKEKNLKDNKQRIEYINSVVNIIAELDPVEKDVYIKKISEDTGVGEQPIYDVLHGKMHNNVKKLQNVNNDGDFGQKLYLEPAYIKAERSLLKFMILEQNSFDYVIDRMSREDFIQDSHKKIFDFLIENKGKSKEELNNIITLKNDDYDTSKEWVNVVDMDNTNSKLIDYKLIDDYIIQIKKYKLEESKKQIMEKIRQKEKEGLINESLELAQKVVEIKKELSKL